MPLQTETVGIYRVNINDPILPQIKVANSKIDPQIASLFAPGEIPIHSSPTPANAKSWYWGLTGGNWAHPWVWVALNHPYVDEVYTSMHEPFHVLIKLLRAVGKAQPLITALKTLTGTPQTVGFDTGNYTARTCDVPEERCADAFAKAQAPQYLPTVLPHFYVPAIPVAKYPEFLNIVATLGQR
jgi:hypothetical protein